MSRLDPQHILYHSAEATRQRVLEVQPVCLKLCTGLSVRPIKRKPAKGHGIENYAQTPNINFVWIGVSRTAIEHLWGEICLSACICHSPLLRRNIIGKAKVYNLAPILCI